MSGTEAAPAATLPADSPAPAGMTPHRRFALIRPRGRFAVPVAQADADQIRVIPPGSFLKRGEPMVEEWPLPLAAPLAPADGKVVGLGVARLTRRRTAPAILFEPDGANSDALDPPPSSATVDSIAALGERLRHVGAASAADTLAQHGVSADRWTCPDLLAQLRAAAVQPVDTLLCSLLDESPELLLQQELAREFPGDLAAGIAGLAAVTSAKEVWIAAAAPADEQAWERLRELTEPAGAKLIFIQDHYPQAHPSLLIHQLSARHVRFQRSPVEVGVLFIDAAAAIAAGRCLLDGQKMLSVPIGFRSRHSDQPAFVSAPIGMPWARLLAHLSIPQMRVELMAGSPLREVRLGTDCVAGPGDLTLTAAGPERLVNADPCIRCGWCVEGCPVQIHPAGLLEAAQQDDPDLGDQYGLDACVECGICSYVCPSHLPILGGIRSLRAANARERR